MDGLWREAKGIRWHRRHELTDQYQEMPHDGCHVREAAAEPDIGAAAASTVVHRDVAAKVDGGQRDERGRGEKPHAHAVAAREELPRTNQRHRAERHLTSQQPDRDGDRCESAARPPTIFTGTHVTPEASSEKAVQMSVCRAAIQDTGSAWPAAIA